MNKKITLCLAFLMLTACGNKTGTYYYSTETATIATTQIAVSSAVTATQTTTSPPKKIKKEILIDVPYYSQIDYPTGCELVSTSMLLAFMGFDIKAGEIIERGYMKAVEVTEDDDGIKYGGDPDEVFIGNPEKNDGYGCHSSAVIKALKKYLTIQEVKTHTEYEITDLRGMTLEEICTEYISEGVPVIVWASIDMNPTFNKLSNSWIIEETGERYLWKSNEHCLVLTGYDEENYYFNDPLVAKDTPYAKRLAERRHGEMGMQAIAVTIKN